MNLADWIRFKRIARKDVARDLGISLGHLSDLCNKRSWISREVARKIYDYTEGDVTPTDFMFDDC